jgi:SAM-dependent methyltransferase
MNIAAYWDSKYREKGRIWGDRHTEAAEISARLFRERGVKTVLEVGCGYGRDLAYLAEEGFSCTGVDVSAEAISMAREYMVGGLNLNIPLVEGSLSHSSLSGKTFDAVYICNLLHLLDKEGRLEMVSDICKVLKPGGVLTGMTLSINDPQEYGKGEQIAEHAFRAPDGRVMYFFTQKTAGEIFSNPNFSIIDIHEMLYHEIFQSGEEHHHLMWFISVEATG